MLIPISLMSIKSLRPNNRLDVSRIITADTFLLALASYAAGMGDEDDFNPSSLRNASYAAGMGDEDDFNPSSLRNPSYATGMGNEDDFDLTSVYASQSIVTQRALAYTQASSADDYVVGKAASKIFITEPSVSVPSTSLAADSVYSESSFPSATKPADADDLTITFGIENYDSVTLKTLAATKPTDTDDLTITFDIENYDIATPSTTNTDVNEKVARFSFNSNPRHFTSETEF